MPVVARIAMVAVDPIRAGTAILLAAASAAHAQPQPIPAQGPWTQPATGMVFPDIAAEFRRIGLYRYDADARDVSANYVTGNPPSMLATLYVYPMPGGHVADQGAKARACQDEFQTRQRELVGARPGANLLRAGATTPPARIENGRTPQLPGFAAAYSFEGTIFGQNQPLASELHVFCYVAGAWIVKYRMTAPDGPDAGPAFARFMATIRWTLRPGAR
jgi:hypothetical protein